MRAGGLVLVLSGNRADNLDKHQAPTQPHNHPLSLHNGEGLVCGVAYEVRAML